MFRRCKRIESAGGKRIELISSYTEGGLTPSYAFIKSGRSGYTNSCYDSSACEVFTYTEEEIEMMKEDIIVAQKLGSSWGSIRRIKRTK